MNAKLIMNYRLTFVPETRNDFTTTRAHYVVEAEHQGKRITAKGESEYATISQAKEQIAALADPPVKDYDVEMGRVELVGFSQEAAAKRLDYDWDQAISHDNGLKTDAYKVQVQEMLNSKLAEAGIADGRANLSYDDIPRIEVCGVRRFNPYLRKSEVIIRDITFARRTDGTYPLAKIVAAAKRVSDYLRTEEEGRQSREQGRAKAEALIAEVMKKAGISEARKTLFSPQSDGTVTFHFNTDDAAILEDLALALRKAGVEL